MTSDQRITGLYLLVSSLFVAVLNAGCGSTSDGGSSATGGSGGDSAGQAGAGQGGLGQAGAGGAAPVGHSLPSRYMCTTKTDCRAAPPRCMGWSNCEARICVSTLLATSTCAPNEVISCSTMQVPTGIAICADDCSFDSTCLPCGQTGLPCCPSAMGNTCTTGTCAQTGSPTGTCQ
jgi:hypothetical protein